MTSQSSKDRAYAGLMAAAQRGDARAFAQLLRELTPRLRRMIRDQRRFLGQDDIEDIVQDVLLSLHSVRATYDPRRPFMPWLEESGSCRGCAGAARGRKLLLLPLLVSPLMAAAFGLVAYRLFRLRPIEKDCACIVAPTLNAVPLAAGTATLRVSGPNVVVAQDATCDGLPAPAKRFSIARILDRTHILSAASICFARGVNDTPKLTALLIAAQLLNARMSAALVAVVMALGGHLFARNVADTMSRRMTRMDATQGLAANLITASLVLFASKFGLPVSTTHVSVGSIAGVGAGAKTIDWGIVRNVLMSWLATLPLAAAIAWGVASVV